MICKRYTEELSKPRIYKSNGREIKVTCVHTRFDNTGFCGCFSETHHLGVCIQGILNTLHSFKNVKEEYKDKELEIMRDNALEAMEALDVLKVQVKRKW